ncbi:MAG: hypothetical protein ACTHKT_05135 [Solirubrobacterales bacterium]
MRGSRGLVVGVLVVAIALALAACGSGGSGSSKPETPAEWIESASLSGVHSGEMETFLKIQTHKPGEPRTAAGEISNMRALGNFMGAGKENPPQLDLAFESSGLFGGHELKHSSGLSLLKDLAVVYLAPQTYQPDKATFEELKSKYQEVQKPGEAGNAMACFEAAEGIDVLSLVKNLKSLGRQADRYGKYSTYISGELDMPAAFDALIQVMEDPACGAQLEALGMPPVAELKVLKGEFTGPVEVVVAVDNRGILREVILDGKGKGMTPGWHQLDKDSNLEAEYRFRLWKPNEVTELPLPSGSTPFESLLKQFGTDMSALKAADGNEIVLSVLEALSQSLSGQNGK